MFVTTVYKSKLRTEWLGEEFIYLKKAESTNTLLKKVPSGELHHGTVLLADHQINGRGQFNRNWLSEPYKNLTFTIALKPSNPEALSLLVLAVAFGMIETLRNLFDDRFYMKWPNDLMINGKKLGGILAESVFNGSKLDRLLIGIGLNTGQKHFPDSLPGATSLIFELDEVPGREELLCRILERVEHVYQRWQEQDKQLIQDINEVMYGFGNWVRVTINGEPEKEKMKFLGVDPKGNLLFLTAEMEVKKYTHEQVRILPAV